MTADLFGLEQQDLKQCFAKALTGTGPAWNVRTASVPRP